MKRRLILGTIGCGVVLVGLFRVLGPSSIPASGTVVSRVRANAIGPTSVAGRSADSLPMAAPSDPAEVPHEGRAERIEQSILQIEEEEGRLFMRLKDLPPERREALKRTMAENRLAMLELAQNSPGSDFGERLAAAQKECDQKVRATIGEGSYENFSRYQASIAYRAPVASLTNAMRAKGVGVSLEQEEAILDAYTSAVIEAAQPLAEGAAPVPDRGCGLIAKRVGALLEGPALDAFLEAQLQRE